MWLVSDALTRHGNSHILLWLFSCLSSAGLGAFENGLGPLFQSERYGPEVAYAFDVSAYPAGAKFDVTMYFAEIFFNATGERVFNVYIEDLQTPVLANLDLVDKVGPLVATSYTEKVTVQDGALNLLFQTVTPATVGDAKISGIKITYDATNQ